MKEVNPNSTAKKHGTISEIADLWLSSVKLKNKLSTYTIYKSLYNNHIQPEIGSVGIEWINSSHIEQLMETKQELSAKTRADILSIIKLVLAYAELNGFRINNSIKTISVHQEKKPLRV